MSNLKGQILDLTGRKFGNWTVLEYSHTKVYSRKPYSSVVYWKCKCCCGKIKAVQSQSLVQGQSKSCGCKQNDWNRLEKGESTLNKVLNGYKRHAKRRGYVFELSKEEFRRLTKQNCHYCGSPPNQEWNIDSHNGSYIYNGIDRVDNSKGYVLSNVVACCGICNKMKRTLSIEEFLIHIDKIHRYMSK